jgi:hypothetical protein
MVVLHLMKLILLLQCWYQVFHQNILKENWDDQLLALNFDQGDDIVHVDIDS